VWRRQLPFAKRSVACGSEPTLKQAKRSGKQSSGGGSLHLRLKNPEDRLYSPLSAKRFVARGSEPSARQAERSGKRGGGGGSPHLPSASLPAVASRLQDKLSAAESGGAGSLAPTCAKRLVDRGSEPSAKQTERSRKWGCGGRQPPPANSQILKAGNTAATIRKISRAQRLAERQLTALQA
jgi:hypothetical protein